MRIDHVEVIHLRFEYPNQAGFTSAGGVTSGRLSSLVKVHTDDGRTGISSVYSHPALIDEVILRQLRPLLEGEDPRDVESLWQKMYRWTRWYGRKGAAMSALGGLDTAFWDLRAQAEKKPLWKLLGGQRSACPAYASALLWQSPRELAAEANRHVERGFRRMKMRLGRSEDEDIEAVCAVRRAIGPSFGIMADASMRYHVELARRIGGVLAENDVFWFEEPFEPDDIDSYASLRGTVGVPLAAGENEFGLEGFRELIRAKAVDIVQPDASRCGGISEMLRVARLAAQAGLKVAPHSWSDAVAIVANAHVVASLPHGLTVEVDQTGNPFIENLLVEPIQVVDGELRLSERPGLGVELDMNVVDRYRLSDARAIPDGHYSDMVFGKAWHRPAGAYRERL
ncbi:MAG TPA: mandelate racemase/muconate lactonizing enzyme family protein [Pirellulales bacterium]|nr:mandelate racemase/muconate lactonizing enzyme family protein [Pirellulales bacterium]